MKIRAYAKINLTLDITGRRADGYHLLDSVMQSVSLYDTVSLTRSDRIAAACSRAELSGEENTVCAAARCFFEATGISGGVEIKIEKQIPVAAGLGGGSADAAAVLRGLDRMYGAGLSEEMLRRIALSVGADVPFCLTGGTARVGGIGETVTPLPGLAGLHLVIAKSAAKPSTEEMYRRLDRNGALMRRDTQGAVDAILRGDRDGLLCAVGNAFADLTGFYGIDEAVKPFRPLALSLSGSGPAVFAVFEDAQQACLAAERLKSGGTECYSAVSVGCGVAFE